MSKNKQKLELTWIGKEKHPKLEPRILLEDTKLSYHAKKRHSENDIFDNVLIHGDNLLALRALEADYSGAVKCVFIDPPYNTGSAFEHYDDGIEHSIWLGLMRDRLEILKRLMANEGSIWITIDDNEAHYLKVLCDEVFGRSNFVANVIWQKKYTVANDAKWFSDNHDHVLVYAKNKESWRHNKLARSDEMNARYVNPDNHPKGPWKATPIHAKSGSEKSKGFLYTFKNGYVWSPPSGTFPRYSVETLRKYDEGNEIWFGKDGKSQPSRKTFLSELTNEGIPPLTVWLHTDVGHNHEAKTEAKALIDDDVFATPKPERLLQRIVHLATNPGDLVLDSFGGSGTTGAVAHKMGRRWIMVELGDHCHTHIAPRLQKVIDGEDQGGISKAVEWKGGGGFRYYNLAPSMLEKDRWGNWIISKEFNPAMLSEALCKIMGFKYAPSDEHYWIHGFSTETDFIYVTTQTMDQAQLAMISQEVGDNRSLLICCGAFRVKADEFSNLTLKKIPRTVLNKCEWGKDDYSLNVQNLPMAQIEPEEKTTKKSKPATTMPLFEDAGE
jgi:adenine-specific DNA-methyltransferase